MKTHDKPDWKDAPSWANYLAFSAEDKAWKWFEDEPVLMSHGNWEKKTGKFVYCDEYIAAKNSLEKRPDAR